MKRLRTGTERRWTRLGRSARLTLVPLAAALLALAVVAIRGVVQEASAQGPPQQTITPIYVRPRRAGRCRSPR